MDEKEEINVLDFSDFAKEPIKPKDKESYYNIVDEYTLDGIYLQTYKSPAAASRVLGVSRAVIGCCCTGRTLFVSKIGRIFLYKGDSIKKRLKQIEKNEATRKHLGISVEVYSKSGRFLSCHNSIVKVATIYHAAYKNIKKCCIGEKLYVGDKIYLFFGDSIKERLKAIKRRERLNKIIESTLLKH